ncbi:MAG TPA: hypothetical protein VGP04_03470 [Pseudonocardiaceae bacterium]|nr:hypothetical protein [Pseudonocardiaceae bacterium]
MPSSVLGHTVTDVTRVLAELTENAVRFSSPEAHVTIRTQCSLQALARPSSPSRTGVSGWADPD